MKIDLDMDVLRALAANGAPLCAVMAVIEVAAAKADAHRSKDKSRKSTERRGKSRKIADIDGQMRTNVDATVGDSPRARLYREGKAALIVLGRTERAAGGLIGGWLKQTHDDDQLVLATILRARDLSVADVAGWVTATLNSKTGGQNGKSNGGRKSLAAAADDLIARISEQGGKGPVIDHDDTERRG